MTDTAEASGILDSHGEKAENLQTFYVYEAPVRLWHWVNAASIVILAVTGYFIATPLWSTPGEASATPGAVLNEIVTAGNCPWWFTASGAVAGS